VISGFQASNIGQLGIEDFSFGSYSRPYSSSSFSAPEGAFSAPGATAQSPFFHNPVLDALGQIAAAWFNPRTNISPARVSEVLSRLPGAETDLPVGTSPRDAPVVPSQAYLPESAVIDPKFETTETVFEEGNEWYARTAPTDWGRVYREWVILNPPKEEQPVFDWLESATTIGQLGTSVGWWGPEQTQQALVQGTGLPGAGPGGTYGPAKVTVDTRTGKVTVCKRRRRRKLLTESDFNVLLRVATLPNKENVRIVLGKAIGRS